MDYLLRIFLLQLLLVAIANASDDPLGVRVVFNRGLNDEAACTAEERATVDDILHLAFSAQQGGLRAPIPLQSCTKLCSGYEPGTCFVSNNCQEEDAAAKTTTTTTTKLSLSSRELNTRCRDRKRDVVSILKREISTRDLSGTCKEFVGGQLVLACHMLN